MSSWSKEQKERLWRWWLAARPDRFTTADAAAVLGLDEPTRGDLTSIGRALAQLGFLKQRVSGVYRPVVGARRSWVYRPSATVTAAGE